MHKPDYADYTWATAYQKLYPKRTHYHLKRMVAEHKIRSFSYDELKDVFPKNHFQRSGKLSPPPMMVFYLRADLDRAFAARAKYTPMQTIAVQSRKRLAAALRGAYTEREAPLKCADTLKDTKPFGEPFQRAVNLSALEVALMDAIGNAYHENLGDWFPLTYNAVLRRCIAYTIVHIHPAMAGRDLRGYLKFVGSMDFDLMTLVGSLGYDNLDHFAKDMMTGFSPVLNKYDPLPAMKNVMELIGKEPLPEDSSFALYQAKLRATLAEAFTDRTLSQEFNYPRLRPILTHLATAQNMDEKISGMTLDDAVTAFLFNIKTLDHCGVTFDRGGTDFAVHNKAAARRFAEEILAQCGSSTSI